MKQTLKLNPKVKARKFCRPVDLENTKHHAALKLFRNTKLATENPGLVYSTGSFFAADGVTVVINTKIAASRHKIQQNSMQKNLRDMNFNLIRSNAAVRDTLIQNNPAYKDFINSDSIGISTFQDRKGKFRLSATEEEIKQINFRENKKSPQITFENQILTKYAEEEQADLQPDPTNEPQLTFSADPQPSRLLDLSDTSPNEVLTFENLNDDSNSCISFDDDINIYPQITYEYQTPTSPLDTEANQINLLNLCSHGSPISHESFDDFSFSLEDDYSQHNTDENDSDSIFLNNLSNFDF